MNRVCLIGRLTTKPELRTTSNNLSTTRFTLAVNRNFSNAQGEREADFISIVAWRRQAETICQYLDKGSQISIEGRIQTGSFDDKDGNRRYTTDVVVDQFSFLESRSQSQSRSNSYNNNSNNYNNNNQTGASTPYDYEPAAPAAPTNNVDISDTSIFADYGDSVSIDDNFLE